MAAGGGNDRRSEAILDALVAGQTDPAKLVALCSDRLKASRKSSSKRLRGRGERVVTQAVGFRGISARAKRYSQASQTRVAAAPRACEWANPVELRRQHTSPTVAGGRELARHAI
ncbi:MAG TPA: hypothetical protein VGD37_18865 [Kofleriaceae bacterium]